ncbi:MAG TPA: hypothetical protein VGW57_00105 [Chthoniobacterales bacterium]|nr:hypothetical protein [Chthoniobacterales bacterium]
MATNTDVAELDAIYYKLLDLFEEDDKNVTHVSPATVLGVYPLGYGEQGLQNFYNGPVWSEFEVRISTDEVGTDATVWALTKKIHEKGERA